MTVRAATPPCASQPCVSVSYDARTGASTAAAAVSSARAFANGGE